MNIHHEEPDHECRPRVIIWQLTPREGEQTNGHSPLSQQECMLVIDSIARVAKSIVVLTGSSLTRRNDLFDIVAYGHALGLKMILEVEPEELTEEVLARYHQFGNRIFRLILGARVVEDPDTRYRQSPEFLRLEECVKLMKRLGFEIHFALTIERPDVRQLEFNLDYAFRRAAKGVYCHLHFDRALPEETVVEGEKKSLDAFIGKISELKPLLPNNMYCSPQCVKYVPFYPDEFPEVEFTFEDYPKWMNQCLAGKSFAFINELGRVFVCSGMMEEAGDLRANGYNFKEVWSDSPTFTALRDHRWTCTQTRLEIKEDLKHEFRTA
jgi:MoaA/NifB/PqqE/SkfB family radical SAM enzyme